MLLRQLKVEGLAPLDGEQFTHQILVPLAAHLSPSDVMTAQEKFGILVGTCKNPLKHGHHALRVGTQFVTAQGRDDAYLLMVAKKVALVLDSLAPR